MNGFEIALAFIFGLFFGSFANVCIYRLPRNESVVMPRSKCTACGKALGVFDLIPLLSWVWLQAKCRYCGEKIAPRYFLVELLTGIVFSWVYVRFGLTAQWFDLILFSALSLALVVIFFIDLDHKIIPNEINFSYALVGLVAAVYPHYPWNGAINTVPTVISSFLEAIYGGLLGLVILLAIERVSYLIYGKPAMGMGDVKLAAMLGIFFGWRLVALTLFFSFMYGAVFGVLLVIFKVVGRRDYVPFGPYIVLAAFTAMFYGPEIIEYYTYHPILPFIF